MFRYVVTSGMNSAFNGAQDFIDEWISDSDVTSWTVVGEGLVPQPLVLKISDHASVLACWLE